MLRRTIVSISLLALAGCGVERSTQTASEGTRAAVAQIASKLELNREEIVAACKDGFVLIEQRVGTQKQPFKGLRDEVPPACQEILEKIDSQLGAGWPRKAIRAVKKACAGEKGDELRACVRAAIENYTSTK